MNVKNIISILVILFLPMAIFYALSGKDKSYAEKNASQNKPQIIKFTSQMCLDCKELQKTLDKVYPKYATRIELIEIQVQDNTPYTKKQIEKYNVKLVPTVVILDKNGKKINRYEGSIEKTKLEKIMEDLVNGK